MTSKHIFILVVFFIVGIKCNSQDPQNKMAIIAYYMGDGNNIEEYKTDQLTHIIYSFLHLKGNSLSVDNEKDSIAITRLVGLKKTNPQLKIILSLGGWGGCITCSEVFNTPEGRNEFAVSVLKLLELYHADGLDLDWEYPALESVKGHKYMPEDKTNFTFLVQTLRKTLGDKYEISFAAGGFEEYFKKSVEWEKVMPIVDYVNVMSYDLVNGNSTKTGHLTSLYSTTGQKESTDNAVMILESYGVPKSKIVIGLAFYARLFKEVPPEDNGLYQKCKFEGYVSYKDFDEKFGSKSGYLYFWDNQAKAPYMYNPSTQIFATFDNLHSVYQKTTYAKNHSLKGVMFWELTGDKSSCGLLDMIYEVSKK